MSDALRGIIVGLGGRARSWINVCRRSSDVELVGYVEPVEERRRAYAEQFQIPEAQLFRSLDEAIRSLEADFVLDVTPPAAHEEIAIKSFEAGLHVLEEKPMSDKFESALRMVEAGTNADRIFMITQNYRFGPVPRTTRRLLEEGIIGTPEIVSVGFYRAWATRPGTHYTTMPYPLITDMGIHHFDMLRYVLNREPVEVQAWTWNPSWGWHAGDAGHAVVIRFEGGLIVTHHALGSSVGKQSPWNGEWRIEGPEGSLTWEEDHIFFTRAYPADKAKREEIPHDKLPLGGQDAILAEFVSAIREKREPECSGKDNLNSLAIVFAAVRSAEEKRMVRIEELF
jgi:predicted dehydrogenase